MFLIQLKITHTEECYVVLKNNGDNIVNGIKKVHKNFLSIAFLSCTLNNVCNYVDHAYNLEVEMAQLTQSYKATYFHACALQIFNDRAML